MSLSLASYNHECNTHSPQLIEEKRKFTRVLKPGEVNLVLNVTKLGFYYLQNYTVKFFLASPACCCCCCQTITIGTQITLQRLVTLNLGAIGTAQKMRCVPSRRMSGWRRSAGKLLLPLNHNYRHKSTIAHNYSAQNSALLIRSCMCMVYWILSPWIYIIKRT